MKGGWRWGAGRPARHGRTSDALRIDVRQLKRKGFLSQAQSMVWGWPSGAKIELRTGPDDVRLIYRYKRHDGTWRDVDQRVGITHTSCRLGGMRQWFVCPRCLRRVAIVFLWYEPKCRLCANLRYDSQSIDTIGRSWCRTQKIEARLAGPSKEWNHRRPKGMRVATYERLTTAYFREEELRDDFIAEFAAKLFSPRERPS